MFNILLIIVISILPLAIRAQDRDSLLVKNDTTKTFYINDIRYSKHIKDSIIVNAEVRKVEAYGDYYRVRIEIANLSGVDIDFLIKSIEAMSGEGARREVLKVLTFDDYMSNIRRRRFFLGDAVTIVDNPEMIIYPINRDDIENLAIESRTIFGEKAQGTTDIDRAYADGNTARYKLRVERNYLRSNTIPDRKAIQGIFMIRRGGKKGDLTVDLKVGDTPFRFEWSIEDISDVKYY